MRTQKAKGIVSLRQNHVHFSFHSEVKVPSFDVISEAEDFANVDWPVKEFPLFARPCPVVPRHGFVDSRPIKNAHQAIAVYNEARAVDPQAELILMPYISASFNAIWTPGVLTVGPSNDGATSGHDSVTIRTTSQPPFTGTKILQESGIKAGDVPYLELVRDKSAWYVVQLRGGPNLSSLGSDYIPKEVKVNKVVLAKGDLLEWEHKAKTFQPGTVVWHPGGSLSSHYGVHCVLNEVPIVTSEEPKVGETLKASEKRDGLDVEEMLQGLSLGVNYEISYNEAVKLLLGSLHNVAFFGAKESRLLGAAVAVTLKLAFCACFGEARHKQKTGLSRDQVYHRAWSDMREAVRRFNEARSRFYQKGWRPGFGGKAWAKCADATAELWNLTVRFVRNKTLEDLKRLVESLNKVVNCAHNNGWWFNKFISPQWFDIAASTPSAPLIVVGHHVHRILREEVNVEGLIAEVEKATASGERERGVEFAPKHVGPFTIGYRVGFGKPWQAIFSDGSVKHCAGLRGISKIYLSMIGQANPSEQKINEVLKKIAAEVGQKPKRSIRNFDEWTIPDLGKADLLVKVTKANGCLRGDVLHVQICEGGEQGYATKDVHLAAVPKALEKVKALPFNTLSLSGSSTPYMKLEVKPDGIYAASDVKVVPLIKGCLKQ